MDYTLHMEKLPDKVLAINGKLVQKFPKNKMAQFYPGVKNSSGGRTNEEIAAFERVIKQGPPWGVAYNDLAI